MKEWALSKGVTHYTHWFQPLTGQLLKNTMLSLKHHMTVVMLEKFGGAQLVQQEPDASSFPNGELEILLKQRIHRLGSYISSVHLGTTLCIQLFYLLHRRSFRL
jgi:glutamine synthetase